MTKINKEDKEKNNEIKETELGTDRFKSKKEMTTLQTRLISTVVMLCLLFAYVLSAALFTSFQGKGYKALDVSAYISMTGSIFLLLGSSYEMSKALKADRWYQYLLSFIMVLFLFFLPSTSKGYNFGFYTELYEAIPYLKDNAQWIFAIGVLIVAIMLFLITFFHKRVSIRKSFTNMAIQIVLVMCYKGFTIASLSLSGSIDGGQATYSYNTILWVWAMIIFADSFAYLGGMRFGKTQLAPVVSPKKTWEGAAIGLSSATGLGIVYSLCFFYLKPDTTPLMEPMQLISDSRGEGWVIGIYVVLSIAFPIISLFGDLMFSAIKRHIGIKDYSNLIPGHGGFLDRLDSFALSFFVVFLLIGFLN